MHFTLERGPAVRDVLLLRAEQRDLVEPEGDAGRAGGELGGEIGGGGEEDAHDVVGGELVAREELLHQASGLAVDLGLRVLGARDRAAQRRPRPSQPRELARSKRAWRRGLLREAAVGGP